MTNDEDTRGPIPASDPKQVITEYIGRYASKERKIHFIKERSILHHWSYIIQYEDANEQQLNTICVLKQDMLGLWHLKKIRILNISRSSYEEEIMEKFHNDLPAVTLIEETGDIFQISGYVIDRGFDVAKIRLLTSNGVVLDDLVENSFVLFLTDQQVQKPLDTELYNRAGVRVSKQIL